MKYDVVIVGAGPGGLACAAATASQGLSTLVLEKSAILGKKICAGGITWNGLMQKGYGDIAERKFNVQYIRTRFQSGRVQEPEPIIATVNREKLGLHMAMIAGKAGAELRTGWRVLHIDARHRLTAKDRTANSVENIEYTYLVGADGSSSMVRRHLQLPVRHAGIGINYQIPGNYDRMEWHIDSGLFGNGYAWIFPHAGTISIGAYAGRTSMQALTLKKNLLAWAKNQGFELADDPARAELINYDYRGCRFGDIFLTGDAAGLASGLTGEGIYSAIVSGEAVAECIAQGSNSTPALDRLVRNHQFHQKLATRTAGKPLLTTLATEFVTAGLRCSLIGFSAIEMAR